MPPGFDAGRAFVRSSLPCMQVAAAETSPDLFFFPDKGPVGDDIFSKLTKEPLVVFFRHAYSIQGVGGPFKSLIPGNCRKSFVHAVMDIEFQFCRGKQICMGVLDHPGGKTPLDFIFTAVKKLKESQRMFMLLSGRLIK